MTQGKAQNHIRCSPLAHGTHAIKRPWPPPSRLKVKGNITVARKHHDHDDFGWHNVVVVLNDNTDVQQVQGAFKARKKEMSMAALIPGLACRCKAATTHKTSWSRNGSDSTARTWRQAQSAQAAVHETQVQAAKNQAELQQQADALAAQNEALKAQQAADHSKRTRRSPPIRPPSPPTAPASASLTITTFSTK